MFFKLSNEQISAVRKETFPEPETFSIKNCIFKTSGTDTVADLEILLNDSLEKPKIFKKQAEKNYIKLKVFQILSGDMKGELLQSTDIVQIEEIIKKYGVEYKELFACADFIGSKTDENDHIVEGSNITLKYNTNMVFSKKDIGFLSFGMVFYYNFREYSIQENISEKHIIKETLSSNLKIVDVFNSEGKNVNIDIVQDLRVVNKVFSNKDSLNSLSDKVNIEQKVLKLQSQPKKTPNNTQFFSSLYNSRDALGNLNILFFMDYKKIIENYSNFTNIIQNSEFSSEVLKNCKISSLKIVRRQMEFSKESKKRFIPKRLPQETVVSTSQDKNNGLVALAPVENNLASISENSILSEFRAIEVVDKTVYKSKRSFYQYGIELNVNDGFYAYLKDIKEQLNFNVKAFKDYYQETTKIIKTNNQTSQRGFQKQMSIGYYDPILNSFSRTFAEEVFPELYEEKILKSVSFLVSSLKLFGSLNSQEDELLKSLIALASPISTNSDTILYFIRIYEKFISQVENILKNLSNTSFSLQYWFDKEVIDASENPAVGYGFFNKNTAGVSKISNLTLETKIATDTREYVKNNSIPTEKENYKYSSVCPTFISTINKKMSLSSIKDITNEDFREMELEIKRYNSIGASEPQPFLDDDLQVVNEKKLVTNLKTEKLMNKFSFFTKNRALNLSDLSKIKRKANENSEKVNTDIDPELLFLGMLKNSTKKPVFKPITPYLIFNTGGILKPILSLRDRKYREDIPIQIYSLLNKTDTFFTEFGIKYLTDLENNSKFLLLYNTIHQIEILDISKNVKDEKWKLLTKDIYNSIPQNSKVLCKLKLFQDVDSSITSFEEISLPIYDKYFILEKNVSQQDIDKSLEFVKKTFDFSVLRTASTIAFNLSPNIFKAQPIRRVTQIINRAAIPRLGNQTRTIAPAQTTGALANINQQRANIPSTTSPLATVMQPQSNATKPLQQVNATASNDIATTVLQEPTSTKENEKTAVTKNNFLNKILKSAIINKDK
jgi:hypothetical protein